MRHREVTHELVCVLFFFFQAEDGIRDSSVTGVQTCALPIVTSMPAAWFIQAAGIDVTHVPYKGIPQGLLDMIGGRVDMGFGAPEAGLGHVKAGKLKMLAVTGDKPIKSLPDVPTLKEQGIDMVRNGWHGLFAPANKPEGNLDK